MTPGIDVMLNQIEGLRGREGSWSGKCPAHADRNASFSFGYGNDGRVIFHCFAGCDKEDILGALGLGWEDMFPPDERAGQDDYKPLRMTGRISSTELLRCIGFEAQVVMMAALSLSAGEGLTTTDMERLWTAHARIEEALRIQRGT